MSQTTLFFATDVHGSDVCFRKFLNAGAAYGADILVLGGDVTGKRFVPIVSESAGWRRLGDEASPLRDAAELEALHRQLASEGAYPVVMDPDEATALTADPEALEERCFQAVADRIKSWVELAEERLRPQDIACVMQLGNDDDERLGDVMRAGGWAVNVEGSVHRFRDFEIAGFGYSNPTPWDTPREADEPELARRIDALVAQVEEPQRAIWAFHCPPHDTGLDVCPALDEDLKPIMKGGQVTMAPVGSTAVAKAIQKHQPLAGLHGHVHESRAQTKIGRTICVNPGSDYGQGVLRGALLRLDKKKVKAWTFTTG